MGFNTSLGLAGSYDLTTPSPVVSNNNYIDFTATATTMMINCEVTGTSGHFGFIDDFSIQQAPWLNDEASFTDNTQVGAISTGATITMDGANTKIVVGQFVTAATGVIPENTHIITVTQTTNPAIFVLSADISSSLAGGTALTFSSTYSLSKAVGTIYQVPISSTGATE